MFLAGCTEVAVNTLSRLPEREACVIGARTPELALRSAQMAWLSCKLRLMPLTSSGISPPCAAELDLALLRRHQYLEATTVILARLQLAAHACQGRVHARGPAKRASNAQRASRPCS